MEQRFHFDFSQVRIHTDDDAGRAALSLGARAFTTGQDVYFAPSHFQPDSRSGIGLLAHELTHVVQQRKGRVSRAASLTMASSFGSLEDEAEAAERAFQHTNKRIRVGQVARAPFCQRSISETLAAVRAAAAGGIEAAADYVASLVSRTDALIGRIQELRLSLRGYGRPLILPPAVVAQLDHLYRALRAAAPSWLPIPEISLTPAVHPAAVLVVGGVAIGVVEILLILAIILVVLWLVGNLDPATRRARERAAEDLIEKLKEATRPRPAPEPKKTTDVFPPVPEPRRRRPCTVREVGPRGGDELASLFCEFATGSPSDREYRITTPEGDWADFDAMIGGVVYECKCGYASTVRAYDEGQYWAVQAIEGPEGLEEQMLRHHRVATACGYPLRYFVSNREVEAFLNERWGGNPLVVRMEWSECD